MNGCFCIGPQNGEPMCPCRMRESIGMPVGPFEAPKPQSAIAPQVGWKCPVCGKGNAPFMPTCGNQLCGVDLSKGANA